MESNIGSEVQCTDSSTEGRVPRGTITTASGSTLKNRSPKLHARQNATNRLNREHQGHFDLDSVEEGTDVASRDEESDFFPSEGGDLSRIYERQASGNMDNHRRRRHTGGTEDTRGTGERAEDENKYSSKSSSTSICSSLGVSLLILLCDTDLESACNAIIRKRGNAADRKGYLQYLISRFIFPIFPAVLCWILTMIARISSSGCTLLSSFLWYFVSLLLVTYSFFHQHNACWTTGMSASRPPTYPQGSGTYHFFSFVEKHGVPWFWIKLVGGFSTALVVLEGCLTLVFFNHTPVAWAVSNIVFGLMCLVGLPAWFWAKRRKADIATSIKYQPTTRISLVALFTIFVTFIANWMSYNYKTHYWGLLTPLFAIQIVAVTMDSNKNLHHNFSYLVFFTTVMLHIPDFLGHSMMRYFDFLEEIMNLAEHKQSLQVYKVFCSWVFLVLMTTYMMVLKSVVRRMGRKYTTTRFLYIGQLYYYMFWYLLIVEEKPTDWTFWAMLLLQNLNYILMNTGIYEDLNNFRIRRCATASKEKKAPKAESAGLGTKEESGGVDTDKQLDEMKDLQFLVQMAENDHLADTTSLVVVTTTVILWVLLGEKDVIVKEFQHPILVDNFDEGGGFGDTRLIERHQKIALGNLFLRFVFTFTCRLVSQRISHIVFSLKMRCLEKPSKVDDPSTLPVTAPLTPEKERQEKSGNAQSPGPEFPGRRKAKKSKKRYSLANLQFGDGRKLAGVDPSLESNAEVACAPNRKRMGRESTVITDSGVRIPRGAAAVILEFEDSFWFFFLATIGCCFSCLQRPDTPIRFAFCREFGGASQ